MRCTAAGSLPGTDFRGAVAAVVESVSLPYMPELPQRGIEAGIIGRALGLLTDLPVDLQPSGWRLAPSGSREQRRARAWWRRDLDDMEELLRDVSGDLKIAVAGPWTVAASVHLPRGELALADRGAVRDVAQALGEGLDDLLQDLGRRLPGIRVVLQVDEPLLPAVSEGRMRTASALRRHEPVGRHELVDLLGPFAPQALLHCCDGAAWLGAAREAGFGGVAVDARDTRGGTAVDELARLLDEGHELHLGVVDTTGDAGQRPDELVTTALQVLRPLEADPARLRERVVLSSACGLAGWTVPVAHRQQRWLAEAATLLAEELDR